MSDVFIFNFGLDERQYRNIIERLDTMTAQFDQLNAELTALKTSNDALVTLTNQIFAALQAALANGTGMTADEVAQLVASINAMKTTDDSTVTADTPPAPAP